MQVAENRRKRDNYAMERFARIALVAITLAPGTLPLSDHALADSGRDAYCRELAEKIRSIEARMRQPYTAAQGVRLEARLRELKRQRYRRCR